MIQDMLEKNSMLKAPTPEQPVKPKVRQGPISDPIFLSQGRDAQQSPSEKRPSFDEVEELPTEQAEGAEQEEDEEGSVVYTLDGVVMRTI